MHTNSARERETLDAYLGSTQVDGVGAEMYALVRDLYPICRSITGAGLRQTLARVARAIPLEVHEVPSGTQAFDWTVPKEWNIRAAWIKGPDGRVVVDFRDHNLHVVSYSVPIHARVSLDELKPHLHSLPEHPDWIPYRTSYYSENWGFCLSDRQLQSLEAGTYEVFIDATLADGSLTYAESVVPGRTEDEVLVFAHCCHPSLCNDNLSGIALATYLARALRELELRYTYRFVFAPVTIGAITWLSLNQANLSRIKHGLVAAVVGDPGPMTYKKSRFGDADIDRAVLHTLKHSGGRYEIQEFSPWGYDERQFGSPGIALPVGRLTRTPNGCYPEYHTSADNLELVRPDALAESWRTYLKVFNVLENNTRYRNTSAQCEPQLGKRGLYRRVGGYQNVDDLQFAMLWILNQSTGTQSLLDIAERSGIAFETIHAAARNLRECGLLERVSEATTESAAI